MITNNTLTDIDKKILDRIKSKPLGIFQSDIWKDLKIDSKSCSRTIKKLETLKYITRESCKSKGVRTSLIKIVKIDKIVDPMLLLAGDKIVPCAICNEECKVENCKELEEWIYELVFSEVDTE